MTTTAKSVSFENKLFNELTKHGEENGRGFSAEINFVCKKYLEIVKK